MRQITEYLSNKVIKPSIIHATNETIYNIVSGEIKRLGLDADLNHIDVSSVTHMPGLFNASYENQITTYDNNGHEKLDYNIEDDGRIRGNRKYKKINVDISHWDVSQVVNMCCMFYKCEAFNCDLSHWNIENLHDARFMFFNCGSFNQDLSSWSFKNVTHSNCFTGCRIDNKFKPNFRK